MLLGVWGLAYHPKLPTKGAGKTCQSGKREGWAGQGREGSAKLKACLGVSPLARSRPRVSIKAHWERAGRESNKTPTSLSIKGCTLPADCWVVGSGALDSGVLVPLQQPTKDRQQLVGTLQWLRQFIPITPAEFKKFTDLLRGNTNLAAP